MQKIWWHLSRVHSLCFVIPNVQNIISNLTSDLIDWFTERRTICISHTKESLFSQPDASWAHFAAIQLVQPAVCQSDGCYQLSSPSRCLKQQRCGQIFFLAILESCLGIDPSDRTLFLLALAGLPTLPAIGRVNRSFSLILLSPPDLLPPLDFHTA